VTRVEKGIEPRRDFPDASVDPTEARNKLIETAATVAIGEDWLMVALDRR
jgi:hypothetical protein